MHFELEIKMPRKIVFASNRNIKMPKKNSQKTKLNCDDFKY